MLSIGGFWLARVTWAPHSLRCGAPPACDIVSMQLRVHREPTQMLTRVHEGNELPRVHLALDNSKAHVSTGTHCGDQFHGETILRCLRCIVSALAFLGRLLRRWFGGETPSARTNLSRV